MSSQAQPFQEWPSPWAGGKGNQRQEGQAPLWMPDRGTAAGPGCRSPSSLAAGRGFGKTASAAPRSPLPWPAGKPGTDRRAPGAGGTVPARRAEDAAESPGSAAEAAPTPAPAPPTTPACPAPPTPPRPHRHLYHRHQYDRHHCHPRCHRHHQPRHRPRAGPQRHPAAARRYCRLPHPPRSHGHPGPSSEQPLPAPRPCLPPHPPLSSRNRCCCQVLSQNRVLRALLSPVGGGTRGAARTSAARWFPCSAPWGTFTS